MTKSSAVVKYRTVDSCYEIIYSYNMEIVLDACAIIAVIANSLSRMLKKGLINDENKMKELIKSYQKIPIRLIDNNLENVIDIVWNYKIYAYDAFYLETAKSLNYHY